MKLPLFLSTLLFTSIAFAGNTNYEPNFSDLIVDSPKFDLDKDGVPDNAFVLKPQKQAQENGDVWIKLSSEPSDQYYRFEGVIAITSEMQNEFSKNNSGSLVLSSSNAYTVSKYYYTHTMTFVYRNGKLILAGYTYDDFDRLEAAGTKCDNNLLAKKGELSGDYATGKYEILATDIPDLDSEYSIYPDDLYETFVNGYCNTIEGNESDQ